MKTVWSEGAEQAYLEFLVLLRDAAPASARRAQREIERSTNRLARQPYTGREARWPGLRELSFTRWKKIVVYQVKAEQVSIVAFYDARQDLTKAKPKAAP